MAGEAPDIRSPCGHTVRKLHLLEKVPVTLQTVYREFKLVAEPTALCAHTL